MIPIFPFFAICLAVGLLNGIFPGLFPAAAGYAGGAAYWVGATINNTRRLIRNIVIYGTIALVTWFGLLAFAIHTKWWPAVLVGFISTGLTALLMAIMMFTVNKLLTGITAHLLTTATAWSAAIKLQTMPWNSQPLWLKIISLVMSPVYGLYLLVFLPTKAVLEIVKAVAAFAPTVSNWLKNITVIISAVSVCSWFLMSLLAFQLEFGMTGPLNLYVLGLSFAFIAILVALMLMRGSAMVQVLDFIQALGFISLFMLGFIGLHNFLPDLINPLTATFGNRYHGVVNNATAHEWFAMILLCLISGILCRLPWCKSFAGPLSLGLLFLWVFSTDYTVKAASGVTPFYVDWQWWATFAFLLLSWLFMKSWKVVSMVTNTNTANPGAPAPVANGGGGRKFPWKAVMVSAAVAIALIFLGMMAFRSGAQAQVNTLPPQVMVVTPTILTPSQTSGIVVNDPRYNLTPYRTFKVLKSDPSTGEYQFELDARELKQTLPVLPDAGQVWTFSFSDVLVCAWGAPCTDASGQTIHSKPGNLVGALRATFNADDFIAQFAFQQEVVAYTGDGNLELGGVPQPWSVTSTGAGKSVYVGFNLRQSEKDNAKGGGILTLKTK
jgi:hypothetical protein